MIMEFLLYLFDLLIEKGTFQQKEYIENILFYRIIKNEILHHVLLLTYK